MSTPRPAAAGCCPAYPLWSPDGRLIAYLSTKDGKGSIPAGEDTNKTSPAATATHRI